MPTNDFELTLPDLYCQFRLIYEKLHFVRFLGQKKTRLKVSRCRYLSVLKQYLYEQTSMRRYFREIVYIIKSITGLLNTTAEKCTVLFVVFMILHHETNLVIAFHFFAIHSMHCFRTMSKCHPNVKHIVNFLF